MRDRRDLWQTINLELPELMELEMGGFERGKQKGKTMNVNLNELVKSLNKQYADFILAFCNEDKEDMKRCLADIRNVAGCVFLKIQELEHVR